MTQTSKSLPTVPELERELAIYFAAVGLLMDDCYMPGSSARMLGVKATDGEYKLAPKVDVRATQIGRMLPLWAKYAYEGIVSAGYEQGGFDVTDGPLERLRDMLNLLQHEDPYFQECLTAAQTFPLEVPLGGLSDLVDRVMARSSLDSSGSLSLEELALLANMNERSVRNAVTAIGDGHLQVGLDGRIHNEVASRWLHGRRGFVATQNRQMPLALNEVPDLLDEVEIPPYVRHRLKAIWTPVAASAPEPKWANTMGYPGWIVAAAQECGLSIDRLDAATRLPLDIKPLDGDKVAQAIQVDRVWFNQQLMTALFPDPVDMLVNPFAWRADTSDSHASESVGAVTVTLTDKMLAHGYIDLPMSAKTMFPEDSFKSHKEGDEGGQVELVYGNHKAQSDIRIKSSKTISPRRRFNSWLNTELGARPGDRIRVEKVAERQFKLVHIAS